MKNKFDMEIGVLFRISRGGLPSLDEQFANLFRFAKLIQNVGIPLDQWYPAAPTEKESFAHKAFGASGPTQAALSLANSNNADEADFPTVGVWNGVEGSSGSSFSSTLSADGVCKFEFHADGVLALSNYTIVADLLEGALQIWPAICAEVAPFKYGIREMQVFPNRPGVGWMLYLPHVITQDAVPEARMLRHVTDLNGHKGTIVISEIDEVFSADNPEHVHAANRIEIRLADLGLLPKYADL